MPRRNHPCPQHNIPESHHCLPYHSLPSGSFPKHTASPHHVLSVCVPPLLKIYFLWLSNSFNSFMNYLKGHHLILPFWIVLHKPFLQSYRTLCRTAQGWSYWMCWFLSIFLALISFLRDSAMPYLLGGAWHNKLILGKRRRAVTLKSSLSFRHLIQLQLIVPITKVFAI